MHGCHVYAASTDLRLFDDQTVQKPLDDQSLLLSLLLPSLGEEPSLPKERRLSGSTADFAESWKKDGSVCVRVRLLCILLCMCLCPSVL